LFFTFLVAALAGHMNQGGSIQCAESSQSRNAESIRQHATIRNDHDGDDARPWDSAKREAFVL